MIHNNANQKPANQYQEKLICINCGEYLYDRSCKVRCLRCGYFEDCSDGGNDHPNVEIIRREA